jgi:hypothetical protein
MYNPLDFAGSGNLLLYSSSFIFWPVNYYYPAFVTGLVDNIAIELLSCSSSYNDI